jgi:type VI secretion system protein VasG
MNLKGLVARLSDTSRRALEGAAGLCLARTHYDVEIEHLLIKLAEDPTSDVAAIFQHFGVNTGRFLRDAGTAIDRFKTGNARTPAFSPHLAEWLSDGWLIASLDHDSTTIRSGDLLLALLAHESLGPLVRQSSRELANVKSDRLREAFDDIVAGSAESRESGRHARDAGDGAPGPASGGALDQFTIDLTARARDGHIDPVTGRDAEIRQLVDILMRRRQNNPILTGEAGVGKTAVVEGFALRIAAGDVPAALRHVAVRTLDLGLLQAGAGIKGEFENRLKSVIDEVKASPQPIILFIDEAHTLIGAGGQAGQNDAANLLKPALARGELRTIAATTWSEYKKYFEKDAALARRFQVVRVEEPAVADAVVMMRHLVPRLESHHQVRILDEAVDAAVRLSDRYLSGRQLPDKAVSVLDTACARLSLNQAAAPGPVEDARRVVDGLDLEIRVRERESMTSERHDARLAEARVERDAAARRLEDLEARWQRERTLVEQIRRLRGALEGDAGVDAVNGGGPARREDLTALQAELSALQGDSPLMQPVVDSQTVADVISGWTGIPVGKMRGDEIETILSLKDRLEHRVLGQAHALSAISERLRISRAGLEDPRKPIGVFLLVGPSGVGKTETALTLADTLYGGEQNLITINMSEYQEAHTVSTLKGSPPGYVGYGEGGVLTEAVRRKPYSVVLLDEVEKAHPDVMELFFQVFDKGMLEDGEGREIDFKNTVILLTSNVGSETVMKLCADEETRPDPDALASLLRTDLLGKFPAALLGRLMVVPYYPVADGVLRQIIRLQLARISARLRHHHRAAFTYDDDVVAAIRARCTEVDSGARNVEHILMRSLMPDISREVLGRMATADAIASVHVAVDPQGGFRFDVR